MDWPAAEAQLRQLLNVRQLKTISRAHDAAEYIQGYARCSNPEPDHWLRLAPAVPALARVLHVIGLRWHEDSCTQLQALSTADALVRTFEKCCSVAAASTAVSAAADSDSDDAVPRCPGQGVGGSSTRPPGLEEQHLTITGG